VFYVSQDGHVRVLLYSPQGGVAATYDAMAYVNAPLANQYSALTSFGFGGSLRLFYVGQDSHVHELYYDGYSTNFGATLYASDLTANTNGPAAAPGGLTSCWDGSIEHVYYMSLDGHLRELYFGSNGWQGMDLSVTAGGVYAVAGVLTAFVDASGEHECYVSFPNFHIRELFPYAGVWENGDITAIVNGPSASFWTSLTSFTQP